MSGNPVPLTKYYAIMIQPGDGGLGPNEIRPYHTLDPDKE